ncbi:excalibur calcium-binding domain-containing protein [Nonomuraea basaltis]|uniref:excalibur calcium-binding domain-containing protein n=1 Tax=Nonomuraea basaltis TaxID=2495887 RepID=UPI00110C4DC8|nr:excalibur calcium-binding domain-containing protein [Nonomuraea basaltis]TMR92288.1 excalibur calcium-binding domain-containing protein [Nonomuraea basaltis]
MDKPEEPPRADPGEPKASRLTTIVLFVSLVLVVLVAGVLGTVAVLMTRSPDTPLLGGTAPQRLAVPIHFAPVRDTKPAPCPGDPAVLDAEQRTCYLLEDGVTVGAVQRVEPVREKDGQYSVRIAIAPAFKERLVQLIDELAPEQGQVAVVLAPEQPDQPKVVLAAPIVTQPMDGDSMSIAGYTKEEADALTARLLGPTPSGTGTTPAEPGGTTPPTPDPGTTGTTGTTTPPPATTGTTSTTSPGTTSPGTTNRATNAGRAPDRRYAGCKEAVAAGDGPYYKGTHEEYTWYKDVDNNGVACNSADMN